MKQTNNRMLLAAIITLSVFTSCKKKPSSPDTALADAHEVYNAMAVRYDRVLGCAPMSQECLQELRVHGVHRERGWFEFFFADWDNNTTSPLLRVRNIVRSDVSTINTALYNLRKFGLDRQPLYGKLKAVHEKLAYILEQLPVQKEYIDESSARKTHDMLASNQAMLTALYLKKDK